ncbi:MAG: hypothetical protein ACOC5C_05130 [Halobacteriota archaeon]
MRKRMAVGIALLLLVLWLHKLSISTKLAYRSSMDKLRMLMGFRRGEMGT